jgi:hypothetical protein
VGVIWTRSFARGPSLTFRLFVLRTFVPLILSCWLTFGATAATLEGATLPDSVTADSQKLVLNGIGLRAVTLFRIKAYIAGLYLLSPSHDSAQILASQGPKVIVLKFLRAVSKDRIERQFRQGEEENCGNGECDPADEADFERLMAAAPARETGDTFTYFITDKGLRMFANDQEMFVSSNRDLAYRLLIGFIGEHPPTPELRRAMLGLPDR